MKKFIIFCAAAAASAVYCDNNIVKTLPVTAVGGNTAFEMQYPGYVQIGNVKLRSLFLPLLTAENLLFRYATAKLSSGSIPADTQSMQSA